MTFETWITFVLAASINIVSPGPAIALTIRNAMTLGLGRTLFSTLGNITAIGCVGLAVSAGIGALILSTPEILTALRLLGGSYLIYLGTKAWSRGVIRPENLADGNNQPYRPGSHLFAQSLLVGLTNPKMLLFLIALFPLFLDQGQAVFAQMLVMTATFMGLSFLSLMGFALAARQCALLIRRESVLVAINRVIAMIFVTFGCILLAAAVS